MKKITMSLAIIVAICFNAININAQTDENNKLYIDLSKSSFGFDGSSNIHDYSVHAEMVDGFIVMNSTLSENSTTINDIRILQAYITVPVLQLKSNKGKKLESRMYKALKGEQYPAIDYYLIGTEPVALDCNANTITKVRSRGRVVIAGVEKIIETVLMFSIEPENNIRITGEKELLMKDFGVKRPMLLFKTIRTKDEINIKFDLLFTSQNREKIKRAATNALTHF